MFYSLAFPHKSVSVNISGKVHAEKCKFTPMSVTLCKIDIDEPS